MEMTSWLALAAICVMGAISPGPSLALIIRNTVQGGQGHGVATALGACMMTVMGIVAERHGIDLSGMQSETVKEMTKEPPRRIASLRTRLTIPLPADHPHRQLLEQAAHTCPVHKSLHPDIDAAIEFVWG